ncbi:MAG: outer membrane protein assembly factor BamE [Alphaproteobacteria bacterium]|nr:outer membrane protein assembly factor BamE [Alphaproteobacteria bacterium]
MKIQKTLFLSIMIAVLIGACSPTVNTRGNIVEDFRMREITPGVSTQTNVLKSLGSPTTKAPFDENVWYYIGQTMEKKGIFDPEVTEEKVVVVAFDEEGIVQTIEEIDSERLNVPKVRRKTHTGGNEITVMEQLLGNIGRFNKPTGSAARTAGGGL